MKKIIAFILVVLFITVNVSFAISAEIVYSHQAGYDIVRDAKLNSSSAISLLNGYNFKFGAQNATHFKDDSTTTGKINVDVINGIKEKYNCTVDVVGFNGTTLAQEVVNSCRAGQISADVIECNISHARTIAKQGCAADFSKCTTLNKELFTNGMTESVTHNGHIYGVAFDSMATNPMGVLFNKTIVDKYMKSKDVIYDYYKKGTWNFDNFELVAKTCTVDTNGDGRSDIYGVTSNTNIIGMSITANAGGTALKVDERVEATMCNDEGIYALTWLKEKIYNPGYWNYKPDIYVSIASFANGEAAMFVSYLSWYGQIASSAKFEMGFVPMPKGPAQSDYIFGAYDGGCFIVPKTNQKNINAVGTFLNELAATSSKHINASISSMARNGFDATAQSVYKWAITNTSPEFSIGVFGSEISAKVDQSVTDPSKAPKTVMESIKGAAQKRCDDFYAPLYGSSGDFEDDPTDVMTKFQHGPLVCELYQGEVTIIDCDNTVINVIIPSTIDNYPVTTIGEEAFADCAKLVNIAFPGSIISVEDNAFSGCKNLANLWCVNDRFGVSTMGNSSLYRATWQYYTFGIVSGNEKLSATEALAILHAIVGKVEFDFGQKLMGDVDGNGEITSIDALLILQKIVNKIEKFPAEE